MIQNTANSSGIAWRISSVARALGSGRPFPGSLRTTWIDLAGGCHETFALGFCTTLNKATGYGLVNTYALAFGRKQMFADSSVDAVLDGTQVVSDLVTLQKQP